MALPGVRPGEEAATGEGLDHDELSVEFDSESTARRQLARLRRLADDLAGVDADAAVGVIVSAASVALELDQLCVHALDAGGATLRRVAAVGVPEPFLSTLEVVPVGPEGGPLGIVAETGAMVVVDDVAGGREWGARRSAAAEAGIRSSWAVPIVGDGHTTGVASGYAPTVGRPSADLLELGAVYAAYAAAALERHRLLAETRALEATQREAESLRRSHALQREFLSRVSHELRTPLTAVRGYASSLLQPDVAWDGQARKRFLSAIAAESERMARLVDDLLDFSAIESGVLRLYPDWCDVRLVVRAALDCVAPEGAARVDAGMEEAAEPVWADHDRLQQVVTNLVDNGLRHTPAATRVRVRARAGPTPGSLWLEVADGGPGLPARDVDRLFRPYERGDTTATGAGLGLSIVRGIVEAHGGTVTVQRRTPGVAFVVELPGPVR